MTRLMWFSFFIFSFSVHAWAKAPSRRPYIEAQRELVRTLTRWEDQGQWRAETTNLWQRLSPWLTNEAWADNERVCFFGGWPSLERPGNNSCQLPWKTRRYAEQRGFASYGPACGPNLFRCSPVLFGPDLCVPTRSDFVGLTRACGQASDQRALSRGHAHWLEGLTEIEFRQWREQQFAPLRAEVERYCQARQSQGRDADQSCATLTQTLRRADTHVTRQEDVRDDSASADLRPEDIEQQGQNNAPLPQGGTIVTNGGTIVTNGGVIVTNHLEIPDAQFFTEDLAPLAVSFNSVVGGSSEDDQTAEGLLALREVTESLGGSGGELLFGGEDRQGQCRSQLNGTLTRADGTQARVSEVRSSFMDSESCQGAQDLSRYLLGQAGGVSKECEPLRVSAEASHAKVSTLLERAQQLQSGATFYLHVAAGKKKSPNCHGEDCVALSDGSTLKRSQLFAAVEKLSRKGVRVQLSFDAAKSGAFSRELTKLRRTLASNQNSARFCATSAQSAEDVANHADALLGTNYSQEYFPALKRFGNQLSAAACAAGRDASNNPTSTLEEFVRQWLVENDAIPDEPVELDAACTASQMALQALAGPNVSLQDVQNAALRLKAQKLLDDVKSLWLKPMMACWKDRREEVALARKLQSCLPEVKGLSEENQQGIMGSLGHTLRAAMARVADFQAFATFLASPKLTAQALASFQDEFCCLARDMKTGALPTSCR